MPRQKNPLGLLPFGLLSMLIGAGGVYVAYYRIGEFNVAPWVLYVVGGYFFLTGVFLIGFGWLGHSRPDLLADQLDTGKDQFLTRAFMILLLLLLVLMMGGSVWNNPKMPLLTALLFGALAVLFTGVWGLVVYDTGKRLWRRLNEK